MSSSPIQAIALPSLNPFEQAKAYALFHKKERKNACRSVVTIESKIKNAQHTLAFEQPKFHSMQLNLIDAASFKIFEDIKKLFEEYNDLIVQYSYACSTARNANDNLQKTLAYLVAISLPHSNEHDRFQKKLEKAQNFTFNFSTYNAPVLNLKLDFSTPEPQSTEIEEVPESPAPTPQTEKAAEPLPVTVTPEIGSPTLDQEGMWPSPAQNDSPPILRPRKKRVIEDEDIFDFTRGSITPSPSRPKTRPPEIRSKKSQKAKEKAAAVELSNCAKTIVGLLKEYSPKLEERLKGFSSEQKEEAISQLDAIGKHPYLYLLSRINNMYESKTSYINVFKALIKEVGFRDGWTYQMTEKAKSRLTLQIPPEIVDDMARIGSENALAKNKFLKAIGERILEDTPPTTPSITPPVTPIRNNTVPPRKRFRIEQI